MASDLTSIINELEQQRTAIENALAALRDVSGPAPRRRGRPRKDSTAAQTEAAETGEPKKRVLSEAGRKRIIEAAKKRWAKNNAAAPKKRGGGLTAAGRKRLSELMRARWASKNPPKKRSAE